MDLNKILRWEININSVKCWQFYINRWSNNNKEICLCIFEVFCIHEKCQIQSIFIFFRIESFCCCFSVIRYGPTGVTLSARETLTACALVWLSAEDSKALCFYLIWGTVWFYSRVYRPVWSIRLIRILHCHLLCRQYFKTSIFLFCQQPFLPQSHNNLYPTNEISQSMNSMTLRRRMLLFSRTKNKPCTDLLLSLPVRDTGENTVSHKTCSHVLSALFISGLFIYTCIRQTSLVATWHLTVFLASCAMSVEFSFELNAFNFSSWDPCILFHSSPSSCVWKQDRALCEQPQIAFTVHVQQGL